jgi:hypothetical protein
MKKATLLAFALVILPAALSAQDRRAEPRGRMDMPGRMGMMGERGNPARSLIERRDEIGLHAEQVSRLEELARSLDETRAAMRGQMQAMREAGGDRLAMTAEHRQAMQAWRDRMAESGRAMNEGIRSTLTEEQRQKVGPRLRGQARQTGPRMRARTPRGPRAPGAPALAPRRTRGPLAGPPARQRMAPGRLRTTPAPPLRDRAPLPPAARLRAAQRMRIAPPLMPRETRRLRMRMRRWM